MEDLYLNQTYTNYQVQHLERDMDDYKPFEVESKYCLAEHDSLHQYCLRLQYPIDYTSNLPLPFLRHSYTKIVAYLSDLHTI